jgi:hypothetical protein
VLADPYEYFPGDPPLAELLCSVGLGLAALAVLVSVLLAAAVRWRAEGWTERQRSRVILALGGALVLTCVSAAPIAARRFGEWGRLRSRLLELRSEFEHFRSDHPDLNDHTLIERFGAEHQPWLFQFTPEHRPVQITLTQVRPAPRFRVNFGRGGNADFAPDTMWVLYSD